MKSELFQQNPSEVITKKGDKKRKDSFTINKTFHLNTQKKH